MAFKLVCIHPFGDYIRGQEVTDQNIVASLSVDREHNFVRVLVPDPVVEDKPAQKIKD